MLLHPVLVNVLGGWIWGWNTGIIAGLNENIVEQEFGADHPNFDVLNGILTSSIILGAIIGASVAGSMADKIGRKKALAIIGLVDVVFAILLGILQSFALILTARLCLGLAVGAAGCVAPLYVREMATDAHRGKLGTIFQISICATILLAQIANYIGRLDESLPLTQLSWRLQFGVGAVPGLIIFIYALTVLPESSVWLQRQQASPPPALPALGEDKPPSLNSNSDYVSPPPQAAPLPPPLEADAGQKTLTGTERCKWLLLSICLAMANQLTGINAVIFYAPAVFERAGFSQNIALVTFSVVGMWNLISVFISFALVDWSGRRPLMLSALFVMGLGAGVLGGCYLLVEGLVRNVMTVMSVMLFIAAFEVGPGPLFFILATEVFPKSIARQALGFSNALAWFFNLLVSFSFPPLRTHVGDAGTFFLFSGLALLCGLIMLFILPETLHHHKSAVEEKGDLACAGAGAEGQKEEKKRVGVVRKSPTKEQPSSRKIE